MAQRHAAEHRYNRDSLERALIHHKVDYSPPGEMRNTWIVHTNVLGSIEMTSRDAWCYTVGLADKERLLAAFIEDQLEVRV